MAEDHSKDHAKDHKDDKPAAKTAPLRVKKIDDDDAAAEKPATGTSQKTLATALSRAIVIATVIGSLSFMAGTLLNGRYTLVAGSNPTNNFVYRLDRLTGAMQFCSPQQCAAVAKADK